MSAVYRLDRLGVDELADVCAAVRSVAEGASTITAAAGLVTSWLYEHLRDEDGRPAFALLRLYKSHPFGELPLAIRSFATEHADQPLELGTRCLTLLASRGVEPAWDDPAKSLGHRAIPLLSAEMVARLPMVAGLLSQLGIDVAAVVRPNEDDAGRLHRQTYDVFYVPTAAGSPLVPAQDGFVDRYGIESVLGFGGMLMSGDVYAVIGFTTVAIPKRVAELFRSVSMAVKTSLIPHTFAPL